MDIKAIAAAGVDKTWAAIASVLSACTLRDGPVITHNPVTDLDSAVWTHSIALNAFTYADAEKEEQGRLTDAPLPAQKLKAIIRRKDCPAITEITTKAELVIGATLWHVHEAESPPGDAIFILCLRR